MIIFVTGATGVLGRPVVKQLVESGHEVRALSRSPANREQLLQTGAIPLAVDMFEPVSLATALQDCDAVLHLATRIPSVSEMKKPEIWEDNDRIRLEGTRSIITAIESAPSVKTLIYPSISLFYDNGGTDWITADNAAVEPCTVHQSTLVAEEAVLEFARGAQDRKGIVLRFGSFYGPSSPDSVQTLAMAGNGLAMSVADSGAYKSMIWIDDAASAVVDALERAPTGIYDVVEDIPSTQREAIDALANAVGRKQLFTLPRLLLRFVLPTELRRLVARSQRISNIRFCEVTGWRPEVPSQRIGWQLMRDVTNTHGTHLRSDNRNEPGGAASTASV
ncbi:NAD-dependent epimerase/dehydratase family protein [Hoeflea sp. TYP-13]|uniref:NAD-dependent epimerase/dehydratase family protein n=1 Tax=Hoeflea sp. TYP-13 TaxID=3230023 RepID=UPI0034C6C6A3